MENCREAVKESLEEFKISNVIDGTALATLVIFIIGFGYFGSKSKTKYGVGYTMLTGITFLLALIYRITGSQHTDGVRKTLCSFAIASVLVIMISDLALGQSQLLPPLFYEPAPKCILILAMFGYITALFATAMGDSYIKDAGEIETEITLPVGNTEPPGPITANGLPREMRRANLFTKRAAIATVAGLCVLFLLWLSGGLRRSSFTMRTFAYGSLAIRIYTVPLLIALLVRTIQLIDTMGKTLKIENLDKQIKFSRAMIITHSVYLVLYVFLCIITGASFFAEVGQAELYEPDEEAAGTKIRAMATTVFTLGLFLLGTCITIPVITMHVKALEKAEEIKNAQ